MRSIVGHVLVVVVEINDVVDVADGGDREVVEMEMDGPGVLVFVVGRRLGETVLAV